MKTLETDDPIKSQLLHKAAQQREELESEMKELSGRTEKILTNALLIGGALVLTYLAVRGFSGAKKRKSKKKNQAQAAAAEEGHDEETEAPSVVSTMLAKIGAAVATQASIILLGIAKEKLSDYLEARSQQKADEHS